MSLFDYHGRFARSQKDSDSQDEEYLDAVKAALEDESEDSSDSVSDYVEVVLQSDEEAMNAEEAESDADENTDEDVDKASEADTSDDDTEDADSDDADADPDEDVADSESIISVEGDLPSNEESSVATSGEPDDSSESAESLDASDEVDNSEDADGPEDSDSPEDAEDAEDAEESNDSADSQDSDASDDAPTEESEDSTDGNTSKKKKTPASKGKHAAGAHAGIAGEDGLLGSAKKRHGVLKGLGIAACIVVVLVALVYFAGALLFTHRILPNTVVSGHDISLYTNDEVVQLLESIENNYSIEAKMGGAFSFKVTKAQIGLHFDAQKAVDAFHDRYDAYKWPFYIFAPNHDISDELNVEFDPAGYEESFLAAVDEYNKTATPPTDAFIYFDDNSKRYLIEDEIMGTQIDPEHSLAALTQAIHDLQPILRLTEADLVQPKVRSNDEFIIESAKLATSLSSAKISLVVNETPVRDISQAELSNCIHINEDSIVTFDEKALEELCATIAKEFNTIGSERTYTRADGKVITVKDGVYGWGVDEAELKSILLDTIKTGDSASVVVPFETTAAVYVAPGERDWGNRYIDVDLSEQHVRFYGDDGSIIWETDCITGSPDGYHNTPQGVWYINSNMESPSKLVGYEGGKKIYESYVTYWMPFIKNSIGLHDATWQPAFGGSMYANGYGSHGCVNISYTAAQELWNIVREGDVVVTHF